MRFLSFLRRTGVTPGEYERMQEERRRFYAALYPNHEEQSDEEPIENVFPVDDIR